MHEKKKKKLAAFIPAKQPKQLDGLPFNIGIIHSPQRLKPMTGNPLIFPLLLPEVFLWFRFKCLNDFWIDPHLCPPQAEL